MTSMPSKAERPAAAGDGDRRIRRIVIVGGGTAGWVSAGILARALPGAGVEITLVESPDIATVGVGEATIPPFVDLLAFLGIDEADFVRNTNATYKLGIRFDDWLGPRHSYWHPFGTLGQAINRRPFIHAWHRARREGLALRMDEVSACAHLGEAGQFLDGEAGTRAGVRHALHFDAALVARYLRAYAMALGVRRVERTVLGVVRRDDGALDSVRLEGDEHLHGDLFLDCSGFQALLAEQTLATGWVDWSHLLPCDSAIVAPSAAAPNPAPFTRAIAQSAGWRWRIPLQHRTGEGYVYCSGAISHDDARAEFLGSPSIEPSSEPRLLRFSTGRRRKLWNRNCVAIGLSSGFLEPLESTSIHLATSGAFALLEHFPDLDFDPRNIESYNERLIDELERARDFILLHYCLNRRIGFDFWRQMQEVPLPATLEDRIETYRATGRVRSRPGELFSDLSWFYVLDGMGVRPRAYDPLLDVVPTITFSSMIGRMRNEAAAACRGAPTHAAALLKIKARPA